MNLKVSDISFTSEIEWVFELIDEFQNHFYIMENDYYLRNSLSNPLTRKELDLLDFGSSLNCHYKKIRGTNVITSII